jgi:hypothetical protein
METETHSLKPQPSFLSELSCLPKVEKRHKQFSKILTELGRKYETSEQKEMGEYRWQKKESIRKDFIYLTDKINENYRCPKTLDQIEQEIELNKRERRIIKQMESHLKVNQPLTEHTDGLSVSNATMEWQQGHIDEQMEAMRKQLKFRSKLLHNHLKLNQQLKDLRQQQRSLAYGEVDLKKNHVDQVLQSLEKTQKLMETAKKNGPIESYQEAKIHLQQQITQVRELLTKFFYSLNDSILIEIEEENAHIGVATSESDTTTQNLMLLRQHCDSLKEILMHGHETFAAIAPIFAKTLEKESEKLSNLSSWIATEKQEIFTHDLVPHEEALTPEKKKQREMREFHHTMERFRGELRDLEEKNEKALIRLSDQQASLESVEPSFSDQGLRETLDYSRHLATLMGQHVIPDSTDPKVSSKICQEVAREVEFTKHRVEDVLEELIPALESESAESQQRSQQALQLISQSPTGHSITVCFDQQANLAYLHSIAHQLRTTLDKEIQKTSDVLDHFPGEVHKTTRVSGFLASLKQVADWILPPNQEASPSIVAQHYRDLQKILVHKSQALRQIEEKLKEAEQEMSQKLAPPAREYITSQGEKIMKEMALTLQERQNELEDLTEIQDVAGVYRQLQLTEFIAQTALNLEPQTAGAKQVYDTTTSFLRDLEARSGKDLEQLKAAVYSHSMGDKALSREKKQRLQRKDTIESQLAGYSKAQKQFLGGVLLALNVGNWIAQASDLPQRGIALKEAAKSASEKLREECPMLERDISFVGKVLADKTPAMLRSMSKEAFFRLTKGHPETRAFLQQYRHPGGPDILSSKEISTAQAIFAMSYSLPRNNPNPTVARWIFSIFEKSLSIPELTLEQAVAENVSPELVDSLVAQTTSLEGILPPGGGPLLHYAVVTDAPKLVARCLAEGHSINQQDVIGMTPLHWAAAKGRADLIPKLLQAGADTSLKNALGQIPQDLVDPTRVDIFKMVQADQSVSIPHLPPSSTTLDSLREEQTRLIKECQKAAEEHSSVRAEEMSWLDLIWGAEVFDYVGAGISGAVVIKELPSSLDKNRLAEPSLVKHSDAVNRLMRPVAVFKAEQKQKVRRSVLEEMGSVRSQLTSRAGVYLSQKLAKIPQLQITSFDVPTTAVVKLPVGSSGKPVLGSVTEFMTGTYHAPEIESTELDDIPRNEWLKLLVLDVVLGNTDRHVWNIFVRTTMNEEDKPHYQLIPVDHDNVLPNNKIMIEHRWDYLVQTAFDEPFSEEWKEFIVSLNADELWGEFQAELNEIDTRLPESFPDLKAALNNDQYISLFARIAILKKGVQEGLAVRDIAHLMIDELGTKPTLPPLGKILNEILEQREQKGWGVGDLAGFALSLQSNPLGTILRADSSEDPLELRKTKIISAVDEYFSMRKRLE